MSSKVINNRKGVTQAKRTQVIRIETEDTTHFDMELSPESGRHVVNGLQGVTEGFVKAGGSRMNVEDTQSRLWCDSCRQRSQRRIGNEYAGRTTGLMNLITHPTWFQQAALKFVMDSKPKATGIDGMTIKQFEMDRDGNIERLRRQVKTGQYEPQPTRQVEIPKPNGQTRRLGIPCLGDKMVQEAIRMALEPVFEAEFHDRSFGFRPYRSTLHALQQVRENILDGYSLVIEGDIRNCFDEIPHRVIMSELRKKIMDKKFLNLIERVLKAGVDTGGQIRQTVKGTPQGNVLSPILANIVLNKLDWYLESRIMPDKKDGIRFVRYADDWIVFINGGTKQDAECPKRDIALFLERECGLHLSEMKTKISEVCNGFDFLGMHIQSHEDNGRVVVRRTISSKTIRNARRTIKAICLGKKRMSMWNRLGKLNDFLGGWCSSVRIADDYLEVVRDLEKYINAIILEAVRPEVRTNENRKEYEYLDMKFRNEGTHKPLFPMDIVVAKTEPNRPRPYRVNDDCFES